MSLRIAIVVAVSMACSLVATPLVRQLARRLGAVSRPDGTRKVHPQPTPLWGGIAVYLALMSGAVVGWAFDPPQWVGVLMPLGLAAGMLCLVGMWDDRWALSAWRKLPGQILATLPIVVSGMYVDRLVLFGYELNLGWFGAVWTVGWLVLGINAMNLLDGMDGLASLTAMVICLAVAVLAGIRGLDHVLLLSLALVGGLAGFVVYNLPPARIYLGDSGSMVLGLVVSLLALQVACGTPASADLTVMALLLFVPLLDTGLAILRRVLKGQSVFAGDRGHLHHQLLDRGFSAWKVLALLGGFCFAAGAGACSAAALGQESLAWAAVGALTVLLAFGQYIGREEQKLLAQRFRRSAIPQEQPQPLESGPRPPRPTVPMFASSIPHGQPTGMAQQDEYESSQAAQEGHRAA